MEESDSVNADNLDVQQEQIEVPEEQIERYEEVIIIEDQNEGDVPEAAPEIEVDVDRVDHDIPVDQEVVIVTNEEPQRDESGSRVKRRKYAEISSSPGGLSDDSIDADQKCSICLEGWSNYGDHRLCCLRCGHLFGHKCIKQWLEQFQNAQSRRCPECNTKATKKDIRILYAKKLYCLDNAEEEKLKEQLKAANIHKEQIERQLIEYKTKVKMFEYQITSMQKRIDDFENERTRRFHHSNTSSMYHDTLLLQKERSFTICERAGCRVMAYNPWHNILVTSLKTTHPLRTDHGISKIKLDTFSLMPYRSVHNGAIRDLDFQLDHPNIMLSAGFDKRVILTDIRDICREIHHYDENAQLWSCAWSREYHHYFFAGTQNGCIVKYDIRQTGTSLEIIQNPDDSSPIVSLASVPHNSHGTFRTGGLLACHLNTCYAYTVKDGIYQGNRMNLEGPFMSVRYDEKNNNCLVSCRSNTRQQHVRHYVCNVERNEEDGFQCNIVHTFHAGDAQRILSRPCHMYLQDDTLVVANNDSTSNVVLWSVSTGKEMFKLPVHNSVVDTCSFEFNNRYLAILTLEDLHLYSQKEDDR
ncbi:E3 ubiquitin-protein ligase RFWD3-like isoform X1 [Leptopilina boulardi]|uniref:E3 ubiquitin-protein ligase RFWD3-like isoform X1 n=1 Tax=Leptopilina boulardi TaxID=63433 RepID=UPI0021F5A0B5|nr:E3 ubiquitin-protein ligase RFWD3-like isoform X1 [Leptopilina boulardi]